MANTLLTATVLARSSILAASNAGLKRGKYTHKFNSDVVFKRLAAAEAEFLAEKAPNPDGKSFNAKNALPAGIVNGAYESWHGIKARVLPWYDATNDTNGFRVEVIVP